MNFINTVKKEYPGSVVTEDAIDIDGHVTRVKEFPIGINYKEYRKRGEEARMKKAATRLRKKMSLDHVILGVDRLDYTKGCLTVSWPLRGFWRAIQNT